VVTNYQFKVACTDDAENLLSPWSSSTGRILSSNGTPAEVLQSDLREISARIGQAVEKFESASKPDAQDGKGDRLTLAEAAKKAAPDGEEPSCEDLMEVCRERVDATITRQNQLLDSRDARKALEWVVEECESAIEKITANIDDQHEVGATKADQLPQDVLEAAKTFSDNMSPINAQIQQIPAHAAAHLAATRSGLQRAKKELEASGDKLATALDEAKEVVTYQIDWSTDPTAASAMIKTFKKAKDLVDGTEMASSIDELITALDEVKKANVRERWVGKATAKPSVNRQQTGRLR